MRSYGPSKFGFLSFFIDSTRSPATRNERPACKFCIPNHKHTWRNDHELYIHKPAVPSKTANERNYGFPPPSPFPAVRSHVSPLAKKKNVDATMWSRHHRHAPYIPSLPNPQRLLKLILEGPTTATNSKSEGPSTLAKSLAI